MADAIERSAKRRKLDVAPSTPSKSVNGVADLHSESRQPQSSPMPASQNGQTQRSGVDIWREAKAAMKRKSNGAAARPSTGRKPRRREDHVTLDDAGGANGDEMEGRKVVELNGSAPGTPTKKFLDPLRNQRAGSGKGILDFTPKRGTGSLDFFGQLGRSRIGAVAGREALDRARRASEDVEDDDSQVRTSGRMRRTPAKFREEEASAIFEPTRVGTGDVEMADAGFSEDDTPDEIVVKSVPRKAATPKIKSEATKLAKAADHEVTKARSWSSQKPRVQHTLPSRNTTHKDSQDPIVDSAMEIDDSADELAMPKVTAIPMPKLAAMRPKNSMQPASMEVTCKVKSLVDISTLQFSPPELGLIQTILLERLTNRRPIKMLNVNDEYNKVAQVIQQTIVSGESNSMLVIGARGSGKTTLVNQILGEQTLQHHDDFHIVRLNGFIHTDDKIALREIWRQLGREMEAEDDTSSSRNYADTLTTLLALLSHPTEIGQEQAGHVSKSVIFILDEFDLFAHHPRQTLLYNLFDIAQSRKAPIAVLGLTTRIDVVETLEKRVKSRFSHRYVHLSLAKSLVAFEDTCQTVLSIQSDSLTPEEKACIDSSTDPAANGVPPSTDNPTSPLNPWNCFTEHLLTTPAFKTHLQRLYYTTKSIPDFMTSLLLPIATLPTTTTTITSPTIPATDLLTHISTTLHPLSPPDSKLTLLPSLSTLHLALLISAARLDAIYSADHISFALAYDEYKNLGTKTKLQASAAGSLAQGAGAQISSKEVARSAWGDLLECGLVVDDGRGGGRVDVSLEEVGGSRVELGAWGRWAREI